MDALRKPWTPLLAAGLALALAGCHASPEQSAARAVAHLLRENDTRAAAAQLDQSLRQWPDSVDLRRQRLFLLLKMTQINPAVAALHDLPANDPALTTALQSHDPVIRANAAQLIAEHPTPVPSRQLVTALADSHPPVRRYCARELGRRAEPDSLRPLFRLLRDDNWEVRAEAVTGLTRLGNPRAAGWMVLMLGDGDAFVRYQAEQALFTLAAESNRSILRRALGRLSAPPQLAVAAALAKLDDPDALALLRRASVVDSSAIRERAADLIGRAGVRAATNDLARLRSDPDPAVQRQAERAWATLHFSGATPPALSAP